jgi:chromo domain-containing protein 1
MTNISADLILMVQRDISQGVKEQNVQPDLTVQHAVSPDVDVAIPVSPLVERVPSTPRAHRTEEASVHETTPTVPQRPTGTDLQTTLPPVELSSLTAKHEIEEALQIAFTSLFQWSDDGTERIMLDRRALLLFHPVDHQEELELLTRWLLMHHVEVSNAWLPGAWYYHKEQIIAGGSGIVIVCQVSDYLCED